MRRRVGVGERRGNACRADHVLGRDLRLVLELVDDVAVPAQRQASVVTELASDIDDAAAFVQQQAREGVTQRVGRGLVDPRSAAGARGPRTPSRAELVERLDRRFGTGLKTGRAEERVRDLLAAGSAVFADAERRGLDVAATMTSLRSLFDAADDVN